MPTQVSSTNYFEATTSQELSCLALPTFASTTTWLLKGTSSDILYIPPDARLPMDRYGRECFPSPHAVAKFFRMPEAEMFLPGVLCCSCELFPFVLPANSLPP